MAKVQTRRSISVSRVEFEHAQNAARDAHMSLSQFTEIALRALVQLRASAVPVTVAIPVTPGSASDVTLMGATLSDENAPYAVGGLPDGVVRDRFVSDPDDGAQSEVIVEYDE